MTERWRGVALAALLAAAGGGAAAGEAQDRLFALGVFETVPSGRTVVYDHARTGSFDAARLPAIEDGRVEVAVAEGARGARELRVALEANGREQRLNPVPASAGNPLLMVFMEMSVRTMAAVTGGSPFYIRNRMREALRSQDDRAPVDIEVAGATVAAERLTFRPFADDPNRARMGAFADLRIRFTLSDAVPGGYAALEAVAGPGEDGAVLLDERMTFDRIEEDAQ